MINDYNKKTVFASLLFSLLIFLSGCGSSSSLLQHPTTSATLWMQNSAEYEALTTSVYQTALSNLGLALEDSYWTAYPAQASDNLRGRPTAIILDVDETVLDNSPFQARMIKEGKSFDPKQWNDWVMEAKAGAVPGALELAKRADREGIAVFYVTNREAKVEEGTRKNLQKLGFPLDAKDDHILSKNERKDWTSDKTNRRAFVASKYRIMMLFGDDLNDFISAKGISQEQRHHLVRDNRDKWGQKWYVLPNPAYGSWESALYDFDSSMTDTQIDSAKKASLDTKTGLSDR